MKKMKLIAFVASIFAISACSLKAGQVSAKDFKNKIYDPYLKALQLGEFASFDGTVKIIEEARTGIKEVDSTITDKDGKPLNPGGKYLTNHKEEHKYTVSSLKKETVTYEYLTKLEGELTFHVIDEYRQYEHKEKDDGVGNVQTVDIPYNGVKTDYTISVSLNRINDAEQQITLLFDKNIYQWDEANADFKKRKDNSASERYVFIDGADISLDSTKTDVEAAINDFYTKDAILGLYDLTKDLYNTPYNLIGATIETDTHELEILSKEDNYVYRTYDKASIKTESTIVSSTNDKKEIVSYNISQYVIKDSEKPEEFYSLKLA